MWLFTTRLDGLSLLCISPESTAWFLSPYHKRNCNIAQTYIHTHTRRVVFWEYKSRRLQACKRASYKCRGILVFTSKESTTGPANETKLIASKRSSQFMFCTADYRWSMSARIAHIIGSICLATQVYPICKFSFSATEDKCKNTVVNHLLMPIKFSSKTLQGLVLDFFERLW